MPSLALCPLGFAGPASGSSAFDDAFDRVAPSGVRVPRTWTARCCSCHAIAMWEASLRIVGVR
eukprot:7141934-Alexandrium_andersonii.AAC.1